ncbi:39S ribosomal protein L44, mitochondrial [Recurvomyces mirabilis]|uniref:Large ribosomal subunit protein mL53 n=1 Tax=Recurvomyces mirabilis TaxID=574656 RepID=A0AAE0WPS9_9PEZI|nr:39S ribosomal protein L44, mitochondrial [Recurvomyces mirabilis]KAK5155952.1 39S ribosomal protein L44, mitochondrial [Recurvomyces mirabilis]
MLTKYITGVTTAFSPFNARSGKTVRNFLASLPPNARSSMAISVKLFGQGEAEKPASLSLKFSTFRLQGEIWKGGRQRNAARSGEDEDKGYPGGSGSALEDFEEEGGAIWVDGWMMQVK